MQVKSLCGERALSSSDDNIILVYEVFKSHYRGHFGPVATSSIITGQQMMGSKTGVLSEDVF